MIITDPRQIPTSAGPMFVSKGGGTDLFSRLIRWRTNSWCEHSMLFLEQGKFVWESASSWYGEGAMEAYMTPGTCLKFYQLVEISPKAISSLQQYVANRIASPWYHKLYDWVGIVGEAVGFPKIHTPGLEYCTVDNIHALECISPDLGQTSQKCIASIPAEESPGYLDKVMVNYTNVFRLYGVCQYGV